MKFSYLLLSVLLALALTGTANSSPESLDTLTSASTTNYYSPPAELKYLAQATFNGVVVVSTTNPDGSPNAAVLIPSLFEDQFLIMRMAPNQTAINLANDGRAVVTLFTPSEPEEETPTRADVRKHGARLTCVALFSGEEYEAIRSRWNDTVENKAYQLPQGEPILRIEDTQPIG